jgi:hypothetical protein
MNHNLQYIVDQTKSEIVIKDKKNILCLVPRDLAMYFNLSKYVFIDLHWIENLDCAILYYDIV